MSFTVGKTYHCPIIPNNPSIKIEQAIPFRTKTYRITSTNLFDCDFVNFGNNYIYFTNSKKYNRRNYGDNDILGRYKHNEHALLNAFNNKNECVLYCEKIGRRDNWMEKDPDEVPTRPNSPRTTFFNTNINIIF